MKKLFLFLALAGILASCERNNEFAENNPLPLDKPAIMKIFCQSNPGECYQEVKYEYNNNKLISERVFGFGELYSEKTLEYNPDGQLKKEIYDITSLKQEKEYIYNNINQLEKIVYIRINYNPAGEETSRAQSEETYEYKNDLLVKKVETWGSWNIYEYDANKRMITYTSYTTTGEKYHITHYKYKGNLKVEEWAEVSSTGYIMYLHKFKYDNKNRLVKVLENNKIIEENLYTGNKLIEKRIFYFGIDPCFAACCGNYILKYEY